MPDRSSVQPPAKSLGALGEVVCHFYAGLFASTFTHLARRSRESIETPSRSALELPAWSISMIVRSSRASSLAKRPCGSSSARLAK